MSGLTIDLRAWRNSGIGRYLQNLVPLLLPLLHSDAVRVVTRPRLIEDAAWLHDPRLQVIETSAAIYSAAEQKLAFDGTFNPRRALWVPHYNAPLWFRGKMAVTIHDVAPLALPEILNSGLKRRYARLLIERAVSQAEAILCVSEFTAGELVSRLRVARSRITVTHPGLDSAWPDRAEPHRELDGAPYFLFVGNVKPNKNLALLLEAFAKVQERLPHRLVIAGRVQGFGTGDEKVVQQAQRLAPRVRFAGEIPDSALIQLYAGATALVMPSLYEGFGLPLLEAMQLGCPVLASTAGALREVAGDAAMYFDPRQVEELASCLLRATDVTAMQRLREAGRLRTGLFDYRQCARQTADVLNRIL